MYTDINFRTKKRLLEYFESGKPVYVYQPNADLTGFTMPKHSAVALEGPHFPEAHKWYASGYQAEGQLVGLKGTKAQWINDNPLVGWRFIPSPPKVIVVPKELSREGWMAMTYAERRAFRMRQAKANRQAEREERLNTMYRNIVGEEPK